ncbi:MAG TPA: 3-oxoacyl-ACP reductase FabG [Nitrospinota bacterium]|nr:3-oxoacyl-ACP reductase FabG [Nitrospinota bacterium]
MKLDLSGKVALVTGGAKGIGGDISLLLSNAGAKVIINYNKSGDRAEMLKKEISTFGNEADIFKADVSNNKEVTALFDFIRKKFNTLDILINNAGIIKDSLLLSMELSDWDLVQDVNLRGAFLCSKFAVEMMMLNHHGKIINIASIGAIKGGRGQTNYAAAKGGLISFTRACAVELAAKGIQVNAVLPGMILTAMSKRVRKKAGEEILKNIPVGRFGEPVEIANLVLFLASEKSNYITGQAISIDGGLSIA